MLPAHPDNTFTIAIKFMKLRANTILLMACILAFSSDAKSQNNTHQKINPSLFKGKWQLVQTFSMGALHQVKKEDYDGIICFRSKHRYYEEVNYESNHWIIEGTWHVNQTNGTLELTQRHYTLGKLEDHPDDLVLDIIQTDRNNWSGSKTEKGHPLKVFYRRIPNHSD